VELESVLLKQITQLFAEHVAEDFAECSDGQKEAWRGIDPSGAIESKATGGNDVVDVGMMTPTSTVP
jgi:hypothetical protein